MPQTKVILLSTELVEIKKQLKRGDIRVISKGICDEATASIYLSGKGKRVYMSNAILQKAKELVEQRKKIKLCKPCVFVFRKMK